MGKYFWDEAPPAADAVVEDGFARDPGKAATALQQTERTGLAAEDVEADPEGVQEKIDYAGLADTGFRQKAPATYKWMGENPDHAAVAKPEIERLREQEGLGTKISKAWKRGDWMVEMGELGWKALRGTATRNELKRLEVVRQNMAALGEEKVGWELFLTSPVEQSHILWETAKAGGTAAAAGFGAGFLKGILFGPKAATATGLATAGLAAKAGVAFEAATMEAGHAYSEYMTITDDDGNPIDPRVAKGSAAIVGLVNGGLEMVGLSTLTRTIPGLRGLTRGGVRNILKTPTARAAFAKYAKNIGIAMAGEGATEFSQEFVSGSVGVLLEMKADGTLEKAAPGEILDRIFAQENIKNYAFAGLKGITGAGPATAVTSVASVVKDVRDARVAMRVKADFQALGEGLKESEMHKKLPAQTRELMRRIAEDGDDKVYIPIRAWDEHWAKQETDADAIAEEIGGRELREAVAEARLGDEDIAIPLADYAEKLAGTEHNTFFQNEIRTRPDRMNAREAEELRGRLEREEKDAAEADPESPAELELTEIRKGFLDELGGVGMDADEAESVADLHTRFIRTQALRAGLSPKEFSERFPLQLDRGEILDRQEKLAAQARRTPERLAEYNEQKVRDKVAETIFEIRGETGDLITEEYDADDAVSTVAAFADEYEGPEDHYLGDTEEYEAFVKEMKAAGIEEDSEKWESELDDFYSSDRGRAAAAKVKKMIADEYYSIRENKTESIEGMVNVARKLGELGFELYHVSESRAMDFGRPGDERSFSMYFNTPYIEDFGFVGSLRVSDHRIIRARPIDDSKGGADVEVVVDNWGDDLDISEVKEAYLDEYDYKGNEDELKEIEVIFSGDHFNQRNLSIQEQAEDIESFNQKAKTKKGEVIRDDEMFLQRREGWGFIHSASGKRMGDNVYSSEAEAKKAWREIVAREQGKGNFLIPSVSIRKVASSKATRERAESDSESKVSYKGKPKKWAKYEKMEKAFEKMDRDEMAALKKRARRVEATAKFKAFYKGNAKEMYKDGKPILLFRGMNLSFKELESPDLLAAKPGDVAFMTDNKKVAEAFGIAPLAVYASIKKPLVVDAKGADWTRLDLKDDPNAGKIFKKVLSEGEPDPVEGVPPGKVSTDRFVEYVKKMVSDGKLDYDGIIFRNIDESAIVKVPPSDVFVAFEGRQLKSVDAKKFDASDPRIFFQRRRPTSRMLALLDAEIGAIRKELYEMDESNLEHTVLVERHKELMIERQEMAANVRDSLHLSDKEKEKRLATRKRIMDRLKKAGYTAKIIHAEDADKEVLPGFSVQIFKKGENGGDPIGRFSVLDNGKFLIPDDRDAEAIFLERDYRGRGLPIMMLQAAIDERGKPVRLENQLSESGKGLSRGMTNFSVDDRSDVFFQRSGRDRFFEKAHPYLKRSGVTMKGYWHGGKKPRKAKKGERQWTWATNDLSTAGLFEFYHTGEPGSGYVSHLEFSLENPVFYEGVEEYGDDYYDLSPDRIDDGKFPGVQKEVRRLMKKQKHTKRISTDIVAIAAEKLGYDGVVFKNVDEGGDDLRHPESVVAFDPKNVREVGQKEKPGTVLFQRPRDDAQDVQWLEVDRRKGGLGVRSKFVKEPKTTFMGFGVEITDRLTPRSVQENLKNYNVPVTVEDDTNPLDIGSDEATEFLKTLGVESKPWDFREIVGKVKEANNLENEARAQEFVEKKLKAAGYTSLVYHDKDNGLTRRVVFDPDVIKEYKGRVPPRGEIDEYFKDKWFYRGRTYVKRRVRQTMHRGQGHNLFFSTNPDVAATYSDPALRPENASDETGGNMYRARINSVRPLIVNMDGGNWSEVRFEDRKWTSPDSLAKEARKRGYDALVLRNVGDIGGSVEMTGKSKFDDIDLEGDTVVALHEDIVEPQFDMPDVEMGMTAFQDDPGSPLGAMSILPGRKGFNISLLAGADRSTMLHELGHYYLEVMSDLVGDEGASESTKNDFQALIEFAGASSMDELRQMHALAYAEGREADSPHEKIARAFEQYLRTGKAPSSALAQAFARFQAWLTEIYRTALGLNIELTDEVREVFDRLLATEDEIAAAQSEASLQPLFENMKESGMNDKQAFDYTAAVDRARQEAVTALTRRHMAELEREKDRIWKDEAARVREEITPIVDARPARVALANMQKGKLPNGDDLPAGMERVKLNRDSILSEYGEDSGILARLPRPYIYTRDKEKGLHIDLAAELFGFENGREMIDTIIDTPKRDDEIEEEVERIMGERHGDMMTHTELAREAATTAIHNEKRAQLLRKEMRVLVSKDFAKAKGMIKRIAVGVPKIDEVRDEATDIISRKKLGDIRPIVYRRAETRANREALDHLLAGRFHEAFSAKRRELLNHELYRAAVDAKERGASHVKYARRFADKKTRQRIGKAGGGYLEQIEGMLDKYSFTRLTNKERMKIGSLRKWLDEQKELGFAPEIPDKLLGEVERQHYNETPIKELDGVIDAVRTLEHMARLKNKLLASKDERDMQNTVDEIVASIQAHHKMKNEPVDLSPGAKDHLIKGMKYAAAAHARPEFIMEMLDGYQANGPVWNALFKPLVDAEAAEGQKSKEILDGMKKIFEAYTKKERADWFLNKRTFAPMNAQITKANVIAMALNWGNEGNRKALMEGDNLTEEQVQGLLDEYLDERDWNTVQAIWDLIDTQWAEVAALEKDLNGVAPKKVEATPVQTRFGEFRGGYYPISFDPQRSLIAHAREEFSQVKDLFGGSWARAMTKQGHTKERVGSGGRPLRLELGVIDRHLANVVHDLTHRRAIIDINRLIRRPEVKDAIERSVGREYYDQLNPWLVSVAGETKGDNFNPIEKFFGRLRSAATLVNMGFKFTTSVVQVLGYSVSAEELGAKYALKGLGEVYGRPGRIVKAWKFASERSDLIRNRMRDYDRDVHDLMNKMDVAGQKGFGPFEMIDKFTIDKADTYLYMIGLADMGVALPSWMGAYRKAMEGGVENIRAGDEKAAVAFADRTVRVTQGSGGAKDLARVQRGNEAVRLFTMLYSYWSIVFNRFQQGAGRLSKGIDRKKLFGLVFWTWFANGVLEEVVRKKFFSREDEDDDEKWKDIAWTSATYPLNGVVLLRDIVGGADKYGYSASPGLEGMELLARQLGTARRLASGEKDELTKSDYKSAFMTLGYATGLPARQLWLTSEALYDLGTGEWEPENPVEAGWGVLVKGSPRN